MNFCTAFGPNSLHVYMYIVICVVWKLLCKYFLYMCVYVYIHVYVRVYIHIFMCIYTCTCIHETTDMLCVYPVSTSGLELASLQGCVICMEACAKPPPFSSSNAG